MADVVSDILKMKNPFENYRSLDEVEKIKAVKSNEYPHPHSIKKCLGDKLGDIVIDLIPKDILNHFKIVSTEECKPLNFEVKTEHVLSKNIKTTSMEDEMKLNVRTIMDVGEHLKGQVLTIRESELRNELDLLTDELIEKRYAEIDKAQSLTRKTEEREFQEEIVKSADRYDIELTEAIQTIETFIRNESQKEMEKKASRIVESISENLKHLLEEREKELREEFCYHMELARSELFEQFENDKNICELQWEKMLQTLRENNCRTMKHLRASLEVEHVQNLHELELWYEIQNRNRLKENNQTNVVINQDELEISSYEEQLRKLDDEFLEINKDLIVYKNRLKYVVDGYIYFISNSLQKHPNLLERQLLQAKLLMTKVNEIKIEKPKILQDQSTPCQKKKSSKYEK